VSLGSESTSGGSELEGPEEVVGFLEVGSNTVDLVNEIFNTNDVGTFAQRLLNDVVISKGNSLTVDLGESSLVDQFGDGFSAQVSVG
jgi:hypothetical protein